MGSLQAALQLGTRLLHPLHLHLLNTLIFSTSKLPSTSKLT